MGKLPAFQFYPYDWRGDIKLQVCSYFAKGLLIELMCLMHDSSKYGFLLINGQNPTEKSLQKVLNLSKKRLQKGIKELTDNGVLRRDENGVLYCKRMVKDQALREKRREAGKLGGNPNLLNQKVNQASNQNPTPSSSSSSSSSSSLKNTSCSDTEKAVSKRPLNFSDDDLRLANLLSDLMTKNNPSRKPTSQTQLKSWANDCRLMRERDNRSVESIEAVLRWSQQDSFWMHNIYSMGKLREKYDRLFGKMKDNGKNKNTATDTTEQYPWPEDVVLGEE